MGKDERETGSSDAAAAEHCLHTLCLCDLLNHTAIALGQQLSSFQRREREEDMKSNEKKQMSHPLSFAVSPVPTGKKAPQVIK